MPALVRACSSLARVGRLWADEQILVKVMAMF